MEGATAQGARRKLILHFDQHNTIQVAMKLPEYTVTVEEGLNNFMTTVVWGREDERGEWQWISKEPKLRRFDPIVFEEMLFFVAPKIVCAHPNVICCTRLRFN